MTHLTDPYQDVFVSLFCSGQVALRAYTGGSIVLKSAFRNASSVILRMSPSIITGLLYRLFSAVKVDKPSKWCEIYKDLNHELIAFLSLIPISCRFGVASKETCNASPSILRGYRCLYPPCDRVQISDLMRSSYRLDFFNWSRFVQINSPYFILETADCSQIEHNLGMGD